ncbi:hypothetical protein ABT061_40775 [Streptosporangium sp. NPDC002544]
MTQDAGLFRHGERPEDYTPLFAAYVQLQAMANYVNKLAGTEIDWLPAS